MDIPIYYDAMIAKLIVTAKTRLEAIELMKQAIQNYTIEGIKTTLDFGTFVMNHPSFINGHFDTNFVSQHFSSKLLYKNQEKTEKIAGLVALRAFLDDSKNLTVAK